MWDPGLNALWSYPDEIYSTSADGRYAFAQDKIYDTTQQRVVASMPVTTRVSAFNSTSNKLVVQQGTGITFVALGTSGVFGLPAVSVTASSQTSVRGSAVVFSVQATSPTPLTYQWQVLRAGSTIWSNVVDGANYSGATTTSLTVSGSLVANNGDQYRVVVTNAAGSVTSSAATLTVTEPVFAKISAGRYHGLRLDTSARLYASGTNTFGQLGNGTTISATTPQPITILGQVIVDIAAGAQHSLILTSNKELWATGFNGTGQLGDGTTVAKSTPIRIATDVVGLAAGVFHSAFLKADGTLWTVGGNDSGQLGNGATTDASTPVQVAAGVVDLVVGIRQTFFVKADRTLWGMGDMNGSGTPVSTPVQIASNVSAVAAGGYHSLFIKTDGTLWGLGYNIYGQVGNGTTTDSTAPVQIATGVKAAAAGYFHSVFIKTDGTLWAVGYNSGGQLGDGTTATRLTPFQMATNVATATASESYTMFAKNDGTLWASGYNAYGQFGNGGTATTSTPVQISTGVFPVPAAPVGLSASTVPAFDRVRLVWQPAADAATYEVWRNTTNDSGSAIRIAQNVRWAIYEDLTAASGQAFSYWIKAVNAGGMSEFSQPAFGSSSNSVAPSITTQPASQSMNVGTNVTFSVVAGGTAPFSYQWRKGNADLAGAVAATYTINSVTLADAGDYRVIVANSAGSTTSAAATLTVNQFTQSIIFGVLPDVAFGVAPLTLAATASSGLPVSFAVVSGPATISGNSLTLTGVGTVTVRASQVGDPTYAAAPSVDRSFIVAPSFASWLQEKFTPAELVDAAVSGPNAVYGADGIPNLVKYALGLEPKMNATTGLPEMSVTGSDWVYTYTRPANRTDVSCLVESSTDLATWATTGVTHEFVSTSGGVETWRARVPLSSAAKVFFRLQVSRP